PEEYCEFHRLHGTQDEIDTEELWELISKFAGSKSFQRTFMQSLARHFEINRKYFDVMWEEMQGMSARNDSNPKGQNMQNTRNHPTGQPETLRSDSARLVTEALAPNASFSRLEAAAKTLTEVTERGVTGDTAAHHEYQRLL